MSKESNIQPDRLFKGGINTTPLEPLLVDDPEALAESIDEKIDNPLTEDQVKGLLALERAGKNRTPHVQVLMKRLKAKSPYEITPSGPPYTNDVTSVTRL